MKTQAKLDPIKPSLHITFDSAAQAAFARASAKTAEFLIAERRLMNSPSANAQGIACLEAGLITLSNLAHHPSGQDMTPLEVKNGLDAACFTGLYCLTTSKHYEPLEHVVMMLATITPIPVTRISLPPAAEVFDLQKTTESAWNCYEVIRLWSFPGSPLVFLVSLYQLWNELLTLNDSNRELTQLEEELRHSTGLFRFAMSRFALATAKSKKKGNRPMR